MQKTHFTTIAYGFSTYKIVTYKIVSYYFVSYDFVAYFLEKADMPTPFIYGKIAANLNFANRKAELEQMVFNFTSFKYDTYFAATLGEILVG